MTTQTIEEVDVDSELNDEEYMHAIWLCDWCPWPKDRVVETCCNRLRLWGYTKKPKCPDCEAVRGTRVMANCCICGEDFFLV